MESKGKVLVVDDLQTKVRGFETGAEDYLIKPINTIELEARVRTVLRRRELRQSLI